MAEASSVGKIQLDIELGGNLKDQIKKAAGDIGKGLEDGLKGQGIDTEGITKGINKSLQGMEMAFRNSFDDIRTMADDLAAHVKNALSGIQVKTPAPQEFSVPTPTAVNPSARSKAPPVQIDTGSLKMQMEQLDTVLSQLDQKADAIRNKMTSLKAVIADLSKPSGNAATDFINLDSLKAAQAELEKFEAEHEKIGTKVTAINDKYIKLENRLGQLTAPIVKAAQVTNGLETEMKETSVAATKLSTTVKQIKPGPIQAAGNAVSNLKNKLFQSGNAASSMGQRSSFGVGALTRSIGQAIRRIFVLGLVLKGLHGAFSFFGKAAMASEGFRASLLNVQTALYTAFFPIYQAIMPALITFMNGLAQVINYLAVFISMLFGKTYQASYAGAKALKTSMAAMKGTGAAAKGAGKELKKTGKDSKKMADDVKKSADKAKRALAGFDELNILSFPKDTDDKAPKMPGGGGGGSPAIPSMPDPVAFAAPMSGLADAIKLVSPFLEGLKGLFATLFDPLRDAWATQGPVFMSALHDAIERAKGIFSDFYKVLQSPPVQSFMNKIWQIVILLGAVALRIFADFVGPLIQWFVNSLPVAAAAFNPVLDGVIKRLEALAAPGFGAASLEKIIPALNRLRDAFLPFAVNVGQGLLWAYDYILVPLAAYVGTQLVPTMLDLLAVAFTAINTAAVLLQPLWQWLWDNLFAPIAAFTGGVILQILTDMTNLLIGFTAWISSDKPLIEALVITIGSFAAAWGIVTAAGWLWNTACLVITTSTTLLAGVIAFITSPIGIAVIAIGTIIAIGILLWKNWDTVKARASAFYEKVKEVFNNIKKTISDKLTAAKEKVTEVFNNIKKSIGDKITAAWNKIKEVFDNIKKSISEKVTAAWEKVKEVFSNITTSIGEKLTAAWNKVTEVFGNIVTTLGTKLQAAKDKVVEIFDGIKTAIGEKIEAAKTVVGNVIQGIKDLFSFKFSWPKMPMPHFGLTPTGWGMGDLLKGVIPKLGVNWYAKGGEFDQPSIIGVGENGREAAVPLENNTGWAKDVARLIMASMDNGGGGSGGGTGDQSIRMIMDEREVGRAILRDWNRAERQSGKATTLKR